MLLVIENGIYCRAVTGKPELTLTSLLPVKYDHIYSDLVGRRLRGHCASARLTRGKCTSAGDSAEARRAGADTVLRRSCILYYNFPVSLDIRFPGYCTVKLSVDVAHSNIHYTKTCNRERISDHGDLTNLCPNVWSSLYIRMFTNCLLPVLFEHLCDLTLHLL